MITRINDTEKVNVLIYDFYYTDRDGKFDDIEFRDVYILDLNYNFKKHLDSIECNGYLGIVLSTYNMNEVLKLSFKRKRVFNSGIYGDITMYDGCKCNGVCGIG